MGKRERATEIRPPPGVRDVTMETSVTAKTTTTISTNENNKPKKKISCVRTPRPKAAANTMKPQIRNSIAYGVDFGTSGFAAAMLKLFNCDTHHLKVLNKYPGSATLADSQEKVPTRIAYTSENPGLQEDRWGSGVHPGQKQYAWFKLLLDQGATAASFDSELLSGRVVKGLLELPAGKTAHDLITDYLKFAYKWVMKQLIQSESKKILDATPIQFYFTVPATWTKAAHAATKQAAANAGFGSRSHDTLELIKEPEAAMIAILSYAREQKPELYKAGVVAMIVDMGGGTVDVQTVLIKKLNPLGIEEVVAAAAAKSGGALVDCALHEWCNEKFGAAFTALDITQIGPGSRFMNEWEIVKKSFDESQVNEEHRFQLLALDDVVQNEDVKAYQSVYDFKSRTIVIHGFDIAKMFEKVLDKAYDLVDRQLDCVEKAEVKKSKSLRLSVNMMCLCGGLGSSQYVYQKFTERYDSRCTVLQDDKPWSAVVRGAALCGLNGNTFVARRAPRHYGAMVHRLFDPEVDDESDSFICPVTNTKRASGYIEWVVPMGTKYTASFSKRSKLYITVDAGCTNVTGKWALYSSHLESPPGRVDEPGVDKEGTISFMVKDVWKRQKTGKTQSTQEPKAIDMTLVFKLGDSVGTLRVDAMEKNTVIGSTTIDYTKDMDGVVV